MAEQILAKKLRPNIWIKVNIMKHILRFLAEPFFRLTHKKEIGQSPKKSFVVENALFWVFSMLQWSWKNYGQMYKYIRIYWYFAI